MSKIELTAAKAAAMLGVKEITTADQFETHIAEVVQLAQSQKTQIENLTREKQEAMDKMEADAKVRLAADTETILLAAEKDRKITKDEIPYLKGNVKDQAGYDSLKLYLDAKAGTPTVQSQLHLSSQQNAGEFAGKTWDELDKSGKLVKLKAAEPSLFAELYKNQFGTEYKG